MELDELVDDILEKGANKSLNPFDGQYKKITQEQRYRRRNIRRARGIIGYLISLFCFLLVAPVIYGTAPGVDPIQKITQVAVVFGGFLLISVFVFILLRNGSALILVLRTFNRFNKEEMSIVNALGEACHGLGSVVTVHDDSLRGALPLSIGILDSWLLRASAITLSLVATIQFISFVTSNYFGDFHWIEIFIFILVWALIALLINWTGRRLLNYISVHHTTLSNWEDKVNRIVRRIRHGSALFAGVTVIKLPNPCWQNAVTQLILEADVVVIDLMDPREGIEWETKLALQYVPPEAIVLTYAFDTENAPGLISDLQSNDLSETDKDWKRLSEESKAMLLGIADKSVWMRCTFEGRPAFNGGTLLASISQDFLSSTIAKCLAKSDFSARNEQNRLRTN